MGRGPNRHFPNKAYDSKEAPEKIVNITNLQRNADKNDKEVSPHTGQNSHLPKNLQTVEAGDSVETRKAFCTAGGKVDDTASMESRTEVP